MRTINFLTPTNSFLNKLGDLRIRDTAPLTAHARVGFEPLGITGFSRFANREIKDLRTTPRKVRKTSTWANDFKDLRQLAETTKKESFVMIPTT